MVPSGFVLLLYHSYRLVISRPINITLFVFWIAVDVLWLAADVRCHFMTCFTNIWLTGRSSRLFIATFMNVGYICNYLSPPRYYTFSSV